MKRFCFTLAAALALQAGPAVAAENTLVRVNTFPTARSLPFFVGVEKGFFAKHGIKLEFEFTEYSRSQRAGLAAGKFEVVKDSKAPDVILVRSADMHGMSFEKNLKAVGRAAVKLATSVSVLRGNNS